MRTCAEVCGFCGRRRIVPKMSVILTDTEEERFDAYCREKGFKKSTLAARLIREHLDRERLCRSALLSLESSADGRVGHRYAQAKIGKNDGRNATSGSWRSAVGNRTKSPLGFCKLPASSARGPSSIPSPFYPRYPEELIAAFPPRKGAVRIRSILWKRNDTYRSPGSRLAVCWGGPQSNCSVDV